MSRFGLVLAARSPGVKPVEEFFAAGSGDIMSPGLCSVDKLYTHRPLLKTSTSIIQNLLFNDLQYSSRLIIKRVPLF